VQLLKPAAPGAAIRGTPYAVGGSLRYRISNASLSALHAAGLLAVGDNAFAATFDVALAATNAAPAQQNVRVQTSEAVTIRVGAGGDPITVIGPRGTTADVTGTVALTATTWTPRAAGHLSIGAGDAGSLPILGIEGTSDSAAPYGSVYARVRLTAAGGAARYLSADCVGGRTGVGNPTIAYSERDNQPGGDQGCFTILAYLADPFVTVPATEPVAPPPPPPSPPPPGGQPPSAGPPAAARQQPVPVAPAATPKGPRTTIRSTRMALRRGRSA